MRRQSPFCILTCGHQQFRTRTCVAGGRNPSWDEAFRVHVGNEEYLEVDILVSEIADGSTCSCYGKSGAAVLQNVLTHWSVPEDTAPVSTRGQHPSTRGPYQQFPLHPTGYGCTAVPTRVERLSYTLPGPLPMQDDTSPKLDELIGFAQIPVAPLQLRSTGPQQLQVPVFSSKSHDLRNSGSKSNSSGFLRAALGLSSSFSRSSRKACGFLSVVLQWAPSLSPGGTSRGSARWSPPAAPPPHAAPYQLSRIRALSFAASTGTPAPPVFVQRAASAHVRTPPTPRPPLPPLPPTAHSPAIPRAALRLPSPAHNIRTNDRHSSPPVGSPHTSAAAGAAAGTAAAPAVGGDIPGSVRDPRVGARGSATPGESRVRHVQALSAPGSAVYSATERGREEHSTAGTEGVGGSVQQLMPPQGDERRSGRGCQQQKQQQQERMQQEQQAVVGARSVSASPVAVAAGAAWAAALGPSVPRPGR